MGTLIVFLICGATAANALEQTQPRPAMEFLTDASTGFRLKHHQQWGALGWDKAAAQPGTPGHPLRIGQTTYPKGLGHHANGEIAVSLQAPYTAFRASVGVQWQGGQKGSVVFQVWIDDTKAFECGPLSDSDPAQPVLLTLNHARELRLVAKDGGDGIACDMANWVGACLLRDPGLPSFGMARILSPGAASPPASAAVCGLSIVGTASGPQLAIMEPAARFTVGLRDRQEMGLSIPLRDITTTIRISTEAQLIHGNQAEVTLRHGPRNVTRTIRFGQRAELQITLPAGIADDNLILTSRNLDGDAGVRWQQSRCQWEDRSCPIPLVFPPQKEPSPPPDLPNPHPAIEQELIEWDWRMQDGIDTPRQARSWEEALQQILRTGDDLIRDLTTANVNLTDLVESWERLRMERQNLSVAPAPDASAWEDLWRRLHALRRNIAFRNPLAHFGPLLFVKRVPSSFSHQLTQYYGKCARPGGGLFLLDTPGHSLHCRRLATLPMGSYLHPDVSWDGRNVLFAFCATDTAPAPYWAGNLSQWYHLYEMNADGSHVRQLTDGPYDDFSPRYLPDGQKLFVSTRRGGFHRCGRGPCPVYTLAVAHPDGSDIRTISYHETHEWDPAVLADGRVIYTRWDYVDRHAVHYQQLWTCRPDGSDARAFYGNNTFNPVGVWEARPVPNTHLVMATAGAHHAMTAGSIILIDTTQGIDGLPPLLRLTPDVLFPESEFPVAHWHAPAGVPTPPEVPPEEQRWPGHCYRTPYPLSKDYFLAAYSFDPLIGEPNANPANMFGIYWVDRFGNKELLYRDLNIGSLWPTPLRSRQPPNQITSALEESYPGEGTFLLQNVHESWPVFPAGKENTIAQLRILQVLPKTTPDINTPKVGLANASPGKQVLGTVPVERDGSAYFRAPAGVALSFQALDTHGLALQTMRSLTYLQPGEQATCIGCHEPRTSAPPLHPAPIAATRPPSRITPGPDGSKPLSYPILVQPVLDKHCVSCHQGPEPAGGILLTGDPAGAFTASYNALAPRVPYSEWQSTPGANFEPVTHPNLFGARASRLMTLLLKGHEDITLSADDRNRLATWMDANALFYGTFDPKDQQRQQQGERIAGPALE